jgi:hypothetical protein
LIVGTAVFIYVTGGRIIDPTNTSWLMNGDAAQHYSGWRFFRETPLWQWPLGNNPKLGMEYSSSIVFTDSLPLGAFISKYLRAFLPDTFQYFGIWLWLCFVLQALFTFKVLQRFIVHRTQLVVASTFLVLSPALIYRLVHQGYGHMALAGHFVLLAALHLYLSPTIRTTGWAVLMCATALIHAYLMPMIFMVWVASLVRKRSAFTNQPSILLKHIFCVATALFLTLIASGYAALGLNLFIGDSDITPESWNYIFRWQPMSFVDVSTDYSSGWSHFLFNQKELFGDVEGFSYLGSGIILLLIASCALVIFARLFASNSRRNYVGIAGAALPLVILYFLLSTKHFSFVIFCITVLFLSVFASQQVLLTRKGNAGARLSHVPLLIGASLLAIYSMTNRPGIGRRTFFEYPLVPVLKSFTDTFRTHGRSIWPAYYLVIIVILVVAVRHLGKRGGTLLLVACLLFQIVDSDPAIAIVRHRFTEAPSWSNPMSDPYWEVLAAKYDNLVIFPPIHNDEEKKWITFTDFAADHSMATNAAYFSRWDTTQYEGAATGMGYNLLLNELNPKSLYIIVDNDFWDGLIQVPRRVAFQGILDGFRVVAPQPGGSRS